MQVSDTLLFFAKICMAGTRYPQAPITEAVIDIQVVAPVTVEELANANAGDAGYSKAELMFAAELRIGPPTVPAQTVPQQVGFMFRSTDNVHVYQARRNGFALSRIGQYSSWHEFSNEARRLWNNFRGIARVSAITRVAVRYINRIDIPLPIQSFSDYLRTVPQLSPDLPQGVSGYLMQLHLPVPEVKGLCIINEMLIDPAKPATLAVVLDIDLFRTEDPPADETQLWELLEEMRHSKNRVFEACITDEARRLFQ